MVDVQNGIVEAKIRATTTISSHWVTLFQNFEKQLSILVSSTETNKEAQGKKLEGLLQQLVIIRDLEMVLIWMLNLLESLTCW